MDSKKFTQVFYLKNKFLGTCRVDHLFIHGQKCSPRSIAWFCPKCGDIWARCATISIGVNKTSEWSTITRICGSCGSSINLSKLQPPGTIIDSYLLWNEQANIDDLPEKLILNELNCELNAVIRRMENETAC